MNDISEFENIKGVNTVNENISERPHHVKPTVLTYFELPEQHTPAPFHTDIWMIDIGSVGTYCGINTLSLDEKHKMDRIIVPEKRMQYVASCVALRRILAYYVCKAPSAIEFAYGPAGKPSLAGTHRDKLLFNISHSHGKMLLGLTSSGEIGIDIEKYRARRLINRIAQRKFTESEQKVLNSYPPEDTARFFCQLWTRKEAVLKAAGTGLLFPMRNIDVSDIQTGHSEFVEPIPPKFEKITQDDWHFFDIDTFEGFCAAVSMNFMPENINIYRAPKNYFFCV